MNLESVKEPEEKDECVVSAKITKAERNFLKRNKIKPQRLIKAAIKELMDAEKKR